MDSVMIRSGKVTSLIGNNNVTSDGSITGYVGRDSITASITGSIAGNTLTVTVINTGLYPGNIITGTGIPFNTYVLQQLSGTTKGVGTYALSNDPQRAPITFASGAITADGSGLPKYKDSPWSTFQAVLQTTSGSGTATVTLYGSNDKVFWTSTSLGTITLAGTTGTSDGFTSVAPWKYIKAVLTALTGTGATCYVTMGV